MALILISTLDSLVCVWEQITCFDFSSQFSSHPTGIQDTRTHDFQIVYAAIKKLPCFINIYAFYHTSIHCSYWSVTLILLIICNFSKHTVKGPWGRCRSTETCRSIYKIF